MKTVTFYLFTTLISYLFLSQSYGEITGNDLLKYCHNQVKVLNNNGYATNYYDSGEQLNDSGVCLGYVAAIGDIALGTKNICPNTFISYTQSTRMVDKYLNDNPEKLGQPAAALVLEILQKSFPCPK